MRFGRKFLVISLSCRLPIEIKVCSDQRWPRNAILAACNKKERCARVVAKIDRCRSVWSEVCKCSLQQHAVWTRNDITFEGGSAIPIWSACLRTLR